MATLILAIHFVVCIFMMIVILLQAGKGADIGASFGGGSQTVFGPRGAATFLSKVTTFSAIVFLLTSIYLAHNSKKVGGDSVVKGMNVPVSSSESRPAESMPAESKPAESQRGK